MSFNKKAMARYMVYDRCFRDENKQFGIHELMEECNLALKRLYHTSGISRRQVYYDIEFMKSPEGFNAPIISAKNDKGKKIMYYEDKSYSIFSHLSGENPVTASELVYLLNIICLLSGKVFVESLISERGYNLKGLTDSVQKWNALKGLMDDYVYLKKLYFLTDAMINEKKLSILTHNSLHTLQPVRIHAEKETSIIATLWDDNSTNKKLELKMNEMEIIKKI